MLKRSSYTLRLKFAKYWMGMINVAAEMFNKSWSVSVYSFEYQVGHVTIVTQYLFHNFPDALKLSFHVLNKNI